MFVVGVCKERNFVREEHSSAAMNKITIHEIIEANIVNQGANAFHFGILYWERKARYWKTGTDHNFVLGEKKLVIGKAGTDSTDHGLLKRTDRFSKIDRFFRGLRINLGKNVF